jgi:hypothetical protein
MALPSFVHADSLRCGNTVISLGDTKTDVLMKCGDPAGTDSWQEEIVERIDAETKKKAVVTTDEWTYNQGPDALIRVLTFRNGKLADIKEGGYGYAAARAKVSGCEKEYPDKGTTRAEVEANCGQPFSKSERQEEMLEAIDQNTKRKVSVTIEEWTYNYGPDRFIRIFEFNNGKLVDIRTGGYGR